MLTQILSRLSRKTRKHQKPEPVAPARPAFEQLEDRLLLSGIGISAELQFPIETFNATGTIAYDSAAQTLDSSATPLAFRASASDPFRIITAPRDFQLHIQVDNAGDLIGGVAGDDLKIDGVIDIDGDGFTDFDGVLLTGEILQFGHIDSGSTTDLYEYRFEVTGGYLASFFTGMDIGIRMLSPNSTFEGDFGVDFSGKAQGILGAVNPLPPQTSDLSGRVYLDANANGTDDAEAGIEGVTINLIGTDLNGNAVSLSTTTLADGSYLFQDVLPGTYDLVEVQPTDYLDNDETAGSLGGTVDNTQDSNTIGSITVAGGVDGTGYNFGEIDPSAIQGLVFEDFNNDGEVNFGESAIQGVTITLTGTDDRGNAVNLVTTTDVEGLYMFQDLRIGTYTITETQPAGIDDGIDSLGTIDGVNVGDAATNDQFSQVVLAAPNTIAENYNFGERPVAGGDVTSGQTATIGFWQNKNGQNLIKSLNGGTDATQLSAWLAATFTNIYGVNAGANDLTGMTNTEVAAFYKNQLFNRKKKDAFAGPPKVDAQVMGVALASYVTNSTLAGTTAEAFGFLVTEYGVGMATFNVGDNGDAFGVADGSEVTILDLLLLTNTMTTFGILYDADGDGEIDSLEQILRTLANEVYTAINEDGDI